MDYFEHYCWPDELRYITCGAKEILRITREAKSKNKRRAYTSALNRPAKEHFSASDF